MTRWEKFSHSELIRGFFTRIIPTFDTLSHNRVRDCSRMGCVAAYNRIRNKLRKRLLYDVYRGSVDKEPVDEWIRHGRDPRDIR